MSETLSPSSRGQDHPRQRPPRARETDLESVAQGLTPPPLLIADTQVVNEGGLLNVVGGLLGLLEP